MTRIVHESLAWITTAITRATTKTAAPLPGTGTASPRGGTRWRSSGRQPGNPFTAAWDISMLPAQKGMAVRAVVHFTDPANLSYETAATGLDAVVRSQYVVRLFPSVEKAAPFWSRAGRKKTAVIPLDIDP